MEFRQVKGVRNFSPEDKIVRETVLEKIKRAFENYGFSPLETSILNRFETLTAKYAGGDEIVKEIYDLGDQGGRELALRYDLTVPLARYIGLNTDIKRPFKRYEIGKVFRDGPVKKGRLREFWQCDADIIGAGSVLAEAEVLMMADEVFDRLGFEVDIKVNNRKILNGIIQKSGIDEDDAERAILTIDKLPKKGEDGVREELKDEGFTPNQIGKVFDLIGVEGSNEEKLSKLDKRLDEDTGEEGIERMQDLLSYLESAGVDVSLDLSLARGLAYYTGTIYEVFSDEGWVDSSLAAGGRWDDMIGDFIGSGEDFPSVGISFGLTPISTMWEKSRSSDTKSVVDVYVIPIGIDIEEGIGIVQEVRDSGINAGIDLEGLSPSKNLDYADSLGVSYAILVGEEELEEDEVSLRNMDSGDQEMMSLEEAVEEIKSEL